MSVSHLSPVTVLHGQLSNILKTIISYILSIFFFCHCCFKAGGYIQSLLLHLFQKQERPCLNLNQVYPVQASLTPCLKHQAYTDSFLASEYLPSKSQLTGHLPGPFLASWI